MVRAQWCKQPVGRGRRLKTATLLTGFLMGCSAQPTQVSPNVVPPVASGPVAAAPSGLVDFTQIKQSNCPTEAINFQEWVARFGAYALYKGEPESVIRTAFANVTENPKIRDRAGKQPEFVTPIWTYIDRAVSAERIAKGQGKLPEVGTIGSDIERDFGVPTSILMGIWGIETDFGNNFGDVNVFEALSNVGYGTSRKDFACTELISALKIVASGKVQPNQMIGSWAGAMGHSQFLPSNYLTVAVDRDGSGAPDLWSSMPDVFASTANHLVRDGWQRGLTWGFEVKLPQNFPYQEAELDIEKPVGHWRQRGVRTIDGQPLPALPGVTSILLLAGYQGPAFLVTKNYKTILKYNYSTSYALSVAYLGQRVMGGPSIKAKWPVNEPALSLSEREELQQRLIDRQLLEGSADGVIGLKTRKAIRAFQLQVGLPADGFATKAFLEQLRRHNAT